MKSKPYLIALGVALSYTTGACAGVPGKCPDIPLGWDGKGELEGWTVAPKYVSKHQKEKKYNFLNAWIYLPGNGPATCHYNYEGQSSNQLSLIISDKDTTNTHFGPKAHFGSNGLGWHCKNGTVDECEFLDGAAPPPPPPVHQ